MSKALLFDYCVWLHDMAIWVGKFPREGYKIFGIILDNKVFQN